MRFNWRIWFILTGLLCLVIFIGWQAQAQTINPVLVIGNSDARENWLQWQHDFPGLQAQVYSFYSNDCSMIRWYLPAIIRTYKQRFGTPPVILNWQGQCDMEKQHRVGEVLSCMEQIMALEAVAWPATPQIWPNIAPEPEYSLGYPSNYAPNIWQLVQVYNLAVQHGVNGLPSLSGAARQLGVPYYSFDAYGLLRAGVWANAEYYSYPSVDPNAEGEQLLDRQGLAPIFQQLAIWP